MTIKQLSLFDDGYVEESEKGRRSKEALLPTPNTLDALPSRSKEQVTAGRKAGKGGYANLRETVVNDLPQEEREG